MIFEDPDLLELKISHYQELLKRPLLGDKRDELKVQIQKAAAQLELAKQWRSLQRQ